MREALREEEAPYIDRLMWTQSDVRTCQVTVAPGAGQRSVRAAFFEYVVKIFKGARATRSDHRHGNGRGNSGCELAIESGASPVAIDRRSGSPRKSACQEIRLPGDLHAGQEH